MDIDKLIPGADLIPMLNGFSSLMDIDKLIPAVGYIRTCGGFSSLMDIDKLIPDNCVNFIFRVLVL